MNILISSAGRRVSLLQGFKEVSERNFGGRHKIYAADANPRLSSACRVADKSFELPRVDDPKFMNSLLEICLKENISLIVPTIDTELKIFAKYRAKFLKEGIHILVSDEELISFCRDKRKTNELFEKYAIKVPKLIDKKNPSFPLFIKPYDGSNSKNLTTVKKSSELTESHVNNEKLVFWEYIDKKSFDEYTIDAYFDKNSKLTCLVPRLRIEVRGGEINKGLTCKNYIVKYLKERLSYMQGARGCITIQLFLSKQEDNIYGIEVNPRFGGGYPLAYKAGANYPDLIIKEYFYNEKIEYFEDWEDKLLMMRYDESVFVSNYED